jgi:hypothetical protein
MTIISERCEFRVFLMQSMRNLILLLVFSYTIPVFGQRIYRDISMLGSGGWHRFSVKSKGVYKVSGTELKSWGIDLNSLSSNKIRLFGNGGKMLPEANTASRIDDLTENPIMVYDGGDGVFNENDYFIFFAEGPNDWRYNNQNKSFEHVKNLYSELSYYYLTTGVNGSRITPSAVPAGAPSKTIIDFEDQYFYENDLTNLLNSGKEWLGEEFAVAPGKKNRYDFPISIPNPAAGNAFLIRSAVAARSFGSSSAFNISIAGQSALTQNIAPVENAQYARVVNINTSEALIRVNQSDFSITYNFTPGSVGATGWLNWFEIFIKRNLDMRGVDQLAFHYVANSTGEEVVEFRILNADAGVMVWDVSDALRPVRMTTALSGSTLTVKDKMSGLKRYMAFRAQNFLNIGEAIQIPNQNLHALKDVDYVIVSHPDFTSVAQKLAQWHKTNSSLQTVVVTTDQIYHEFASGSPDPTAIRDFAKMLYDRSKNSNGRTIKYLLLLGDASYDYQNRIPSNTNLVPGFESRDAFNPLQTYTSDDFFGLLDDNEDINQNTFFNLDIAIGRIPARTTADAQAVLDKIVQYHAPESYGQWRNEITLIADDEDRSPNYSHMSDAEFHAGVVENKTGKIPSKIYLDAFRKQSGSGGARYPEANVAVNNKVLSGTLIWNYSGHGGFRRLAEEVILDNDMVNTWENSTKLPLFVTATCDFAPFDNPQISSLGESLLLRPKTGAIALMTTTRVVFASGNRNINNAFFANALTPNDLGQYPTLGEMIRLTKNSSRDVINDRKFSLLGDPAINLGLTSNQVKTTFINGKVFGSDTLRALTKYEIKGTVTDKDGKPLKQFNGDVYASIFDKSQNISTINNVNASENTEFSVQNNVLFKGKSKAVNGDFSFTFIVPKDINYNFGNGLISYYAYGNPLKASSNEQNIIVGGIGDSIIKDDTGPLIKAYLNDERFVDGGVANQNPLLLINFFDSTGINSAGAGIGHDITATIDEDLSKQYVLNDLYAAETGSYQKGTLRFQLPNLTEGMHVIDIKAWDVANNSSTQRINFRVVKDQELSLANVYNYPNPFTSRTTFMFEHNRPGDLLQVNIRIYSVAGNLVKTIRQTINTTGNRSFEIEWDGTDHFGRKIGRGVYIYDLDVKDSRGMKRSARQKLVLL